MQWVEKGHMVLEATGGQACVSGVSQCSAVHLGIRFLQAQTESGILNVLKMQQLTTRKDFLGFQ